MAGILWWSGGGERDDIGNHYVVIMAIYDNDNEFVW